MPAQVPLPPPPLHCCTTTTATTSADALPQVSPSCHSRSATKLLLPTPPQPSCRRHLPCSVALLPWQSCHRRAACAANRNHRRHDAAAAPCRRRRMPLLPPYCRRCPRHHASPTAKLSLLQQTCHRHRHRHHRRRAVEPPSPPQPSRSCC